jgi:hypothetical protein
MKSWVFGMLALVTTFSTAAATACPTVGFQDDPPVQRPIQNVSLQASQMFERAVQLDAAAASRESTAFMHDRNADTFANRARILRNQASLVAFDDRSNVVALAEELAMRSLAERQQAARARSQAANFRMQARNLRERANQLVGNGNGNGWRRRPIDRAVPSAAETNI